MGGRGCPWGRGLGWRWVSVVKNRRALAGGIMGGWDLILHFVVRPPLVVVTASAGILALQTACATPGILRGANSPRSKPFKSNQTTPQGLVPRRPPLSCALPMPAPSGAATPSSYLSACSCCAVCWPCSVPGSGQPCISADAGRGACAPPGGPPRQPPMFRRRRRQQARQRGGTRRLPPVRPQRMWPGAPSKDAGQRTT